MSRAMSSSVSSRPEVRERAVSQTQVLLPSCDARADSRSWNPHGVSQVNQGLLTHFQDPFLRSVEIRNESDDRRKGEGDGQFGERAARAREARVIAHGSERQDGDREQHPPDGTGNAIPQANS